MIASKRLASRFDGSVYLRGSSSRGYLVPGLSDIDLVVVTRPGAPMPAVTTVHRFGGLVQAGIVGRADLATIAGSTNTTFGLGNGAAAYHGQRIPGDPIGLLNRPGLPADQHGWRHRAGPKLDLSLDARVRQEVREAAWCEIVSWWRFAIRAIVRDEPHPSDAYLCVKLVAEPLRVLLALDGRYVGRRQALVLGPELAPELATEIEMARSLLGRLHRGPAPPFELALPALVSLTRLVVSRLGAELPSGERVRLVRHPDAHDLPLVDWRALVSEGIPVGRLHPVVADPGSPADLKALCAWPGRDVPVIHTDDLLLEPTTHRFRAGRMRMLQAWFSDPVSFAVLAGSQVAVFPRVRGWCASDWARRAVAEKRAWLHAGALQQATPIGWTSPPDAAAGTPAAIGYMLGAARAAQFALSIAEGEPELHLDAPSVAEGCGDPAPSILETLDRGGLPEVALVDRLREHVRDALERAALALGSG